MKSGPALDLDIALKIMGLQIKDPSQVPSYSSDVFLAHKVIHKLQQQGWSCHVRSQVSKSGILTYRAHFYKGTSLHSERTAPNISLAICLAALAIADEQYVEFVEPVDDENPIEISRPLSESGLKEIIIKEEPIADVLSKVLEEKHLPFKDKEGNNQTFHRLFFKLVVDGFMTRKEQDVLPKTLMKFFLDSLKENDYLIVKKSDDLD